MKRTDGVTFQVQMLGRTGGWANWGTERPKKNQADRWLNETLGNLRKVTEAERFYTKVRVQEIDRRGGGFRTRTVGGEKEV